MEMSLTGFQFLETRCGRNVEGLPWSQAESTQLSCDSVRVRVQLTGGVIRKRLSSEVLISSLREDAKN